MARTPTKQSETAFDFAKSLQKLQPESFFRFIREYPSPDGTSIYVYRLQPQIDRSLAGIKDSNIEVATGNQIDEEYLLRQHGSGKYHLKFCDANRPKGLTEVAKCTVDIFDPHVPALINPIELVVSQSNDRLVQKYIEQGWTVENGKLVAPVRAENGTEVLAKTVSEMAGQMASRPAQSEASSDLVRRALDVLSAPKGNGLDETIRVAELLHPRTDPMMVELMKVLVSDRNRAQTVEQPRPDPIAQLKETAGLLKELGWGQGGGGGASWADAISALPGILQYGAQMLQQMVMLRTLQPQPKVVAIDAGRPAAAPPSVSLPADPPAQTAAVQPAAESVDEGADMGIANMFAAGMGFNLNALIEVGKDAVDAFERGLSGEDFAHGLCCRRGGEEMYGKLSTLGKEDLARVISMVPGLAEKLAPRRVEIENWLDSFLKYGAGEPDEKAA